MPRTRKLFASALVVTACLANLGPFAGAAWAANYEFSAALKTQDLRCGYFTDRVVCATFALFDSGPLEGVKIGDTIAMQFTFDERVSVPGSKTSNVVFAIASDDTLRLGNTPPGGAYFSRSTLNLTGVQTTGQLPPFTNPVNLQFASGYQAVSGYVPNYGTPNEGFSFTGGTANIMVLSDSPRILYATTVGFSSVREGEPGVVQEVQGGTPDSPVILPPGQTTGQITARIGGEYGADQYYQFNWTGGLFQTQAQVFDADPAANYEFRLFGADMSLLRQTVLSSSNSFADFITFGNLAAGSYTIGIGLLSPTINFSSNSEGRFGTGFQNTANEAGFAITFTTPVGGVPEPGTWGMLIAGFGLIGSAMRAARRKPTVRLA